MMNINTADYPNKLFRLPQPLDQSFHWSSVARGEVSCHSVIGSSLFSHWSGRAGSNMFSPFSMLRLFSRLLSKGAINALRIDFFNRIIYTIPHFVADLAAILSNTNCKSIIRHGWPSVNCRQRDRWYRWSCSHAIITVSPRTFDAITETSLRAFNLPIPFTPFPHRPRAFMLEFTRIIIIDRDQE